MKVSIIIPIYNVENYIVRCLDSVTQQTFNGEIECILVDDCGTDQSMEIAGQYIHDHSGLNVQFRLMHHTHNQGLSAARNTGIKAATGDYIFFLDSDDAITPNSIETLVQIVTKYQDVDFVQGNFLNDNGEKGQYSFNNTVPEYCNEKEALEELMLHRLVTSSCNRLIKRSLLIERQLFFPVGMIHEDMYWVYFLSKYVHAAAFSTIGTYIYYTNEGSIMTAVSRATRIKRYTSRLKASTAYMTDIKNNNYHNHIRHQYLAVNLLSCLTELGPLKSIKHWMRFWSYILRIGSSNIRKITLYRILFAIILLPPACFICGSSKYRWRVQNAIIRKI